MNLETFPKARFELQSMSIDENSGSISGEFSNIWGNFFTLNTQNLELFFANEGHLVPSRTQSDIDVLSIPSFKARNLYNNDTGNFMGNTGDTYQNYTMNLLSTRAQILSMTPSTSQLQYFGDENNDLYSNVNGILDQIPKNITASTGVLNFSVDGGGNLYATINGVTKQVTLV